MSDSGLPEGIGLAAESGRFEVLLGGERMNHSGGFFATDLDEDDGFDVAVGGYPVYVQFDIFDEDTWKDPTVEVGWDEVEPELERVAFQEGDHIEFEIDTDTIPNYHYDEEIPPLRINLLGFDHGDDQDDKG